MKLRLPKRNRNFWNSDKLFGLTAMLISLVTLIIFVRQTNIMDKQSRLSAMPYLMIETSDNGYEHEFTFELVNYGVGPAIIEGKTIFHNGKSFEMEFDDFLKSNFDGMDTINIISYATIQPGLAIPAGGSRTILKIGGSQDDYMTFKDFFSTTQEKNPINFEIRYRSIYNDRWQISASNEIPQEIK
ncbi:hypothetical protein [Allomuricauda sp. d1]|uniref:hypothetical protein n=1 Tax=Allomuricauda sp. d1 TaxID=3136725 RepID=UPI0031CE1BF0